MKNSSMFKAGIIIIILIILGKVLSFAKDIILSLSFGLSLQTDAYFIAFNITSILFVAFYSSVSLVFLPLYNEHSLKLGKLKTNLFSNTMVNVYLLLSLLISLLSIYFAPQIVALVNNSTNEQQQLLTISLLQIMSLSFVFTIFIAFMTSIQLSNKHYYMSHISVIINNTIVMFSLLLFSSKYGIYVPAVAGVSAWVLQAPLHIWVVRKYFTYKLYINLKDSYIKKMALLFAPAFFGILIDQANIMVDTILASSLAEGSVSAINYASKLINFGSGIFIVAMMSILYPLFSKYIVNNDSEQLTQTLRSSIELVLLVMLPMSVIVLLFNHEIVSIVFQRGKFNENATTVTSIVFLFYGLGLVFLGIRELLNKVFYAQKDTKTPLLISAIAVSVNIVLSIILVKYLAVGGLALASSLSLVLYVALQFFILHKKIGGYFYSGLGGYSIKLLFSLSIASLVTIILQNYILIENLFFFLLFNLFVYLLFYILILYFFKNTHILFVFKKINIKFNKKGIV